MVKEMYTFLKNKAKLRIINVRIIIWFKYECISRGQSKYQDIMMPSSAPKKKLKGWKWRTKSSNFIRGSTAILGLGQFATNSADREYNTSYSIVPFSTSLHRTHNYDVIYSRIGAALSWPAISQANLSSCFLTGIQNHSEPNQGRLWHYPQSRGIVWLHVWTPSSWGGRLVEKRGNNTI